MFSPLIDELMSALRCLPGVGPKSAQRMVLQLLEHDRPGAQRLAEALTQAVEGVGRCERCRTLTEQPLGGICARPKRDQPLVCVVEAPRYVLAGEQLGGYQGGSVVRLGRVPPIGGGGPEEVGNGALPRVPQQEPVQELILATNPTVEAET